MAYLGNSPGQAQQRVTQSLLATQGQTLFSVSSGYALGYLDVFLNGVKLAPADFTASDGLTVTLTQPAQSNDTVDLVTYIPRGLSDGYTKLEADNLLANKLNTTSPSYTGTLTGSTGVVNLGSGQLVKDASGNLGLGRNPNYKIDAYLPGTGSTTIASSNDNIVTVLQSIGTTQANVGTLTSHPLTFITDNTTRLSIDTSGNVNVGTTGDNSTRRLAFVSITGGTTAIQSITDGATNQRLAFSTTFGTESVKAQIDGLGNFAVVAGTGSLGYGTGAGGTVTQGSSSGKATTVTLNRPTGQITMNNALLGSNGVVSFLFNNALITVTDTLLVQLKQAIGNEYVNYTLEASPGAGNAVITLRNISAGSLSDALVINFAVIKGATS